MHKNQSIIKPKEIYFIILVQRNIERKGKEREWGRKARERIVGSKRFIL